MSRPIGPWPTSQLDKRSILDLVGNGNVTNFADYAKISLSKGYPESRGIVDLDIQLGRSRQILSDHDALPPQEFVRQNDEEHNRAITGFNARRDKIQLRKTRYEAMLVAAQAFVPPTPGHQDFVTHLIDQLTDAIASITIPTNQPQPRNPNAFAAARRVGLANDVSRLQANVAAEAASDVTWVKQLRDAL